MAQYVAMALSSRPAVCAVLHETDGCPDCGKSPLLPLIVGKQHLRSLGALEQMLVAPVEARAWASDYRSSHNFEPMDSFANDCHPRRIRWV